MKNLLSNWKTTSAGLTMIITSLVHLVFAVHAHTADENTWTISLLAVIAGAGLIFAGDSSKSADAGQLKNVQAQLLQVPKAIETGDTSLLNKTVEQQTQPPKTP